VVGHRLEVDVRRRRVRRLRSGPAGTHVGVGRGLRREDRARRPLQRLHDVRLDHHERADMQLPVLCAVALGVVVVGVQLHVLDALVEPLERAQERRVRDREARLRHQRRDPLKVVEVPSGAGVAAPAHRVPHAGRQSSHWAEGAATQPRAAPLCWAAQPRPV